MEHYDIEGGGHNSGGLSLTSKMWTMLLLMTLKNKLRLVMVKLEAEAEAEAEAKRWSQYQSDAHTCPHF